MTTLLLTHPSFVEHDTGPGHPERPDRMRAIDKVLLHEAFNAAGQGGSADARSTPRSRSCSPILRIISTACRGAGRGREPARAVDPYRWRHGRLAGNAGKP